MEESCDILVGDIPLKHIPEGFQSCADGLLNLRKARALFDALVDSVLDEDSFQGETLQRLLLLSKLQLQLRLENLLQPLDIAAQHLCDSHLDGAVVLDDEQA